MATGTLPFRGESTGLIFKAILDVVPTPAVRLNHDVPPRLEDIVNKALEKDRTLRYQSGADMRTDCGYTATFGRAVAQFADSSLDNRTLRGVDRIVS